MRRIVQRMRHGSLASALRQWHQTLQQLQEHAWAQERRQVCGKECGNGLFYSFTGFFCYALGLF
jgi:hypothetical protein